MVPPYIQALQLESHVKGDLLLFQWNNRRLKFVYLSISLSFVSFANKSIPLKPN